MVRNPVSLQLMNFGSHSAFEGSASVLVQITGATWWFERILSVVSRFDQVRDAGVPDLRH